MLHRENCCWLHELLVYKWRRLAAVGIGDVEPGAGQLISFGPWQSAHSSLQRTAHAIRETIVEDAVGRTDSHSAGAERIPRQAHARHELAIIDRRDARRHAFVAGE